MTQAGDKECDGRAALLLLVVVYLSNVRKVAKTTTHVDSIKPTPKKHKTDHLKPVHEVNIRYARSLCAARCLQSLSFLCSDGESVRPAAIEYLASSVFVQAPLSNVLLHARQQAAVACGRSVDVRTPRIEPRRPITSGRASAANQSVQSTTPQLLPPSATRRGVKNI